MAKLKKDGNPRAGIPMAKYSMASSAAEIQKSSPLFVVQTIREQAAAKGDRVALTNPFRCYTAQTGRSLLITFDVPKSKLLVVPTSCS